MSLAMGRQRFTRAGRQRRGQGWWKMNEGCCESVAKVMAPTGGRWAELAPGCEQRSVVGEDQGCDGGRRRVR
jgi:hypothetical protein